MIELTVHTHTHTLIADLKKKTHIILSVLYHCFRYLFYHFQFVFSRSFNSYKSKQIFSIQTDLCSNVNWIVGYQTSYFQNPRSAVFLPFVHIWNPRCTLDGWNRETRQEIIIFTKVHNSLSIQLICEEKVAESTDYFAPELKPLS